MAAARAEAQRQAQLQAAQQQNRQNFLAGELITSYWLSLDTRCLNKLVTSSVFSVPCFSPPKKGLQPALVG